MKSEHLHKYSGVIEFYYETGMEQQAAIFHDDRGLYEGPKWDKPEETMMHKSLAWSLWFGQRFAIYNITIFNKDNTVAYQGPLVQDKAKVKRNKYMVSFIPVTLDKRTWFKYLLEERRAELETNDLPTAIMEEHNIKWGVGHTLKEVATGKRALIIGHKLNPDKTFRYLVAILENGDFKIPPTYTERITEDLTEFTLKDFEESKP